MKLKFLLLSMVFLTSCSKVQNILSGPEVNESMLNSISKICKDNGGIKSLELKKDGNAYFFCKKQGFLEVSKAGEILTVKGRDPNPTTEIKSSFVEECVKACGETGIKSLQPATCLCKNGKKVME